MEDLISIILEKGITPAVILVVSLSIGWMIWKRLNEITDKFHETQSRVINRNTEAFQQNMAAQEKAADVNKQILDKLDIFLRINNFLRDDRGSEDT